MNVLFAKQVKKTNSVVGPFNPIKKKRARLAKNKTARPLTAKSTAIKNKTLKKFKSDRRGNKKALYQRMLQVIKVSRPNISLNVDFYRNIEGVYGSYWLGKFINTLQHGGQKKVAARHVYSALASLKYSLSNNPLLIFLETLDKIKPVFRLRNYIVRRVVIKEYPIVVLRPRRLILAVHWIKEEVQAKRNKFGTPLADRIFNLLKDFKNSDKKNSLSKKRNEYINRTVKAQFNIRYNFR